MDRLTGLLLDFGRAPGNYLVRLREPRELFDEFDVVAQWALNRIPQALQHQAEDLRAAAVLFIQRACFAPDGTHYQVLGLQQRDYPADDMRARYRIMIRLAHPDMGVKGLPPNAASLVNRAHEVLTTPALREKYDEQLNSQVAASPIVPPAASRPITRVVQHPHGWQERLHMLKAQHPKALRAALALGSVAVVVAGVMVWVAQETSDTSRMLIVARPPGARPLSQAEPPGAETSSPRLAMSQDLRVGTTARATLPAPREPAPAQAKPAQATRTASLAPVPVPAPAPAATSAPMPATAPGRPASPLPAAETVALARMEQAKPAIASTAAPAPAPVATPLAAPAAAARMPDPTAPQATPAPAPAATAPVPAPAAPAPAPAQPPVAAPSPPPPVLAQQPAAPAWSVDAEGARMYLTELMTKLENPSEARRINAHLKSMKVKGSLLSPAIKTLSDRPDLQVRQSHWTESTKPGVLNVQATVQAQPKAPEAEPRVLRFRVVAEFHGTAEGTMLAVLDFKESE